MWLKFCISNKFLACPCCWFVRGSFFEQQIRGHVLCFILIILKKRKRLKFNNRRVKENKIFDFIHFLCIFGIFFSAHITLVIKKIDK